jgi:outer membrane translocation and assembly module TamA
MLRRSDLFPHCPLVLGAIIPRADRRVDDKEHTVDLAVNVEAGPEFKYGALEIRSLDLNSEPAIRKMWGVKEGKPFDAEYPDAFLKDVHDQGIFDNLGGHQRPDQGE